jgi:sugar diacid utilization regulator/putative methionine-R-sulfoxide reductase with GAF domain
VGGTRASAAVLTELLRHLLTATAPESVAAFAVAAVREATGAEVSWCGLIRDTELTMAAHSGLRTVRMANEWTLPLGVGIGGRVAAEGRPLWVRDYRHDPRRAPTQKTMIDEEGIRAAMCAPLTAGGQVLGVLYAARRESFDWTPEDLTLLTEIAADCGVAIARLRRRRGSLSGMDDVRSSADAILELQSDLADVMGAAGDLAAGVVLLHRRFGLAVDLVDADGQSLIGATPDDKPIRFRAPMPGRAGDRVEVAGDRELTIDEQVAVRAGAVVLGLHLLAIRADAEARRRAARDLVEALIARSRDPQALRSEAALLGLDLSRPHHVVCLGARRPGPGVAGEVAPLSGAAMEQLERAVAASAPGALTVSRNGDAVVVLPARSGGRPQDWAAEIVRTAGRGHRDGLAAGVGRRCTSTRDFAEAFGEASLALDLARRQAEPGAVFTAADLGLTGLLAAGGSSRKTLESLVEGTLGPLLAADAREGTDYVRTLRGWLSEDRHLGRTAALLHVHPNTVRYRIARAQDVLGLDLKNVDNRFQVDLALRVHQALEGTSAAPHPTG